MRIAIVSWTRRRVGGTETYLSQSIPELCRYGHSLGLWVEVDEPRNRLQIEVDDGTPVWCVADMGAQPALSALAKWQPDLIYAHGLLSPVLEAEILPIAPSIFFAHTYYGTCISGSKTFKWPVEIPCSRRFGWECLLQYYPHHCGGWNPVTMVKHYQLQSRRLELLKRYSAIFTLSEHMRSEYLRHGFSADRVLNVSQGHSDGAILSEAAHDLPVRRRESRSCWKLLFLGRMDFLKGGHLLLEALPRVKAAIGPLELTFAGDGPARSHWTAQAAALQAKDADIRVTFTGWLNEHQIEGVFGDTDLLVLPSVWPEPFGLVGPLAGSKGIPAAAFDVGGIREWLVDGVNGILAPGDPPSAKGLALAMIHCLQDNHEYLRLRDGALTIAQRFRIESHARATIAVFEEILGRSHVGE